MRKKDIALDLTVGHIKTLLSYVTDGVQIIDNTGRLVYCNQKAALLDDINIEESIGKHITEVYPSLSEQGSTILSVLDMQTAIINRKQTFRTYRGKEVTTINTTIPLVENNALLGAIEISNDITAYKDLTERYIELQRRVIPNPSKNQNLATTTFTFEDIITEDPEFNRIKTIAMKAARTEIPILIYGETGTGKEMIAQAVHGQSKRQDAPFIAQNCAALPSTLLEGILFGTVKGGFTGAVDRPGLFELADSGTLFLDEINSMPLDLQAKMLRAIQESKIRRIGDTREREINVRILAATNVSPDKAIEEGLLRRDLYYRLNTVTLRLPKLIERKVDIDYLTRYFIQKYNEKLYKHFKGISKEVSVIFNSYPWEGNVRELEHVIEGAMNLSDQDYIEVEDLPHYMQVIQAAHNDRQIIPIQTLLEKGESFQEIVNTLETMIIESALKKNRGNTTRTAKELGLPRQTLQYKLKKYTLK